MIRAAVLGSPISHSLSPLLHNTAYEVLELQGHYEAVEVKSGELPNFLHKLEDSWTGFSLTMPLKEEVLTLASFVDPLSTRIASANTLIRGKDGWHASTTDVVGFQRALAAHGSENFEKVCIIGSGATARAAAAALDKRGRSIIVLHRNPQRERAMVSCVAQGILSFLPWSTQLPQVDLTINTTPAGVADVLANDPNLTAKGLYFEALYNPWPTALMRKWKTSGGVVVDGLDLLIHQAIVQVERMTGRQVEAESLASLLRKVGLERLES